MKLKSAQITEIVWLYTEQDWHIEEIAQRMGVHRSTIYRALNNAGVPKRDDRHTANPRATATHCSWGHEFTQENTYWSNNSRTCKTCHQKSQIIRRFMADAS